MRLFISWVDFITPPKIRKAKNPHFFGQAKTPTAPGAEGVYMFHVGRVF
jgi:hypothetical protein